MEEADHYIDHLMVETFPKLSVMKGFKRASILKKITDKGIEFLTITEWETMDAIKQFAGETPDIAVVPAMVQQMMIDFDKNVSHYEVVTDYQPGK